MDLSKFPPYIQNAIKEVQHMPCIVCHNDTNGGYGFMLSKEKFKNPDDTKTPAYIFAICEKCKQRSDVNEQIEAQYELKMIGKTVN